MPSLAKSDILDQLTGAVIVCDPSLGVCYMNPAAESLLNTSEHQSTGVQLADLLFEDAEAPHPYKTCISLGHVSDRHGKKESKSKGNYTPPEAILESDGADAMRWYFYAANPPYSSTRYSPEAVRQGQHEFLVKVHNVFAFFVIYANIDGFDPAYAPGTGTPEPGGLDWFAVVDLLDTVARTRRIVAADLVEVMPLPGQAVTEFLGARLMYKLMSLVQAHGHSN